MENTNKCPCCSQHCDRNNLQCGKGEAYFSGEVRSESGHSHNHHEKKCCGRHEGKKHGHCGRNHHSHHRPEFPVGSLAELLAKCAHRLFHSEDDTMFATLTEEESSTLKRLLNKLLSD